MSLVNKKVFFITLLVAILTTVNHNLLSMKRFFQKEPKPFYIKMQGKKDRKITCPIRCCLFTLERNIFREKKLDLKNLRKEVTKINQKEATKKKLSFELARDNHIPLIRYLEENNIDPTNFFEKTTSLFMWACYLGKNAIISHFLKKQNTPHSFESLKEALCETDLHLQARGVEPNYEIETNEYISQLNEQNNVKQTPLIVAALPLEGLSEPTSYAKSQKIIETLENKFLFASELLANNANPNVQDLWGNTALHYLLYNLQLTNENKTSYWPEPQEELRNGSRVLIAQIMKNKADLDIHNNKDESPRNMIKENVRLLIFICEDNTLRKAMYQEPRKEEMQENLLGKHHRRSYDDLVVLTEA